jgi:hypothetical protein
MKPPQFVILSLVLLIPGITYSQQPSVVVETKSAKAEDIGAASLEGTMKKFIESLKKKDTKTFLSCFSRSAPFRIKNVIQEPNSPYYIISVSYSELAADLNAKKGYYWVFLDRGHDGAMDCFADAVDEAEGRMWDKVTDDKFVPPGYDSSDSSYVKWKKEGKRWVVAEIAYPQA